MISLKSSWLRNKTGKEMNHRYYVLISTILIVIVTIGLVLFIDFTASKPGEKNFVATPLPLYSPSITPYFNASQDTTQQVNLTLTSTCPSEIAIPVENLAVVGYTSKVSQNFNGSSSDWNTTLQETVFNYSFSLSKLVLQPSTSASATITIHLANNATIGSYSLEINLGKIIFLTPHEKNDVSYSASLTLVMIVTPSANLVSSLITGEYPSSPPPNLLNINGNVTNTGEATAYNAGLHVIAYSATRTLEINVTVPLAYDETFNQDFGTGAVGGGLIGGSYSVTTLDSEQTVQIFLDIYHEGTVTNWTVTPVWTNSP